MKRPWGGLFDFYFHSLGVMVTKKKKSFQKQHTHLYKLLCLYSECLSRPIKMCLNAFFMSVLVGFILLLLVGFFLVVFVVVFLFIVDRRDMASGYICSKPD